MPISEHEILSLMRENAALCNLEAEVIMALKAYEVGDNELFQKSVSQVVVCLQRIDDVRRRNDDTRSQSEEEGS
jgi:hypothetical protein